MSNEIIHIDKVIQESDLEQLKELLNQITFCHPESEFNQEKSDSGFIKVFRIAQILIEYLFNSQEGNKERVEELQERCEELENSTKTYIEQIENLKINLLVAKKELRKRKDLIATTQSEVLGEDNKDEFDPCPYCSKKFLTSTYLYAHMQRRHQGLPIQAAFPTPRPFHSFPNVGFPTQQTFPMVFTANAATGNEIKTAGITTATQTEIRTDRQTAAINHEDKFYEQVVANDEKENSNDFNGAVLDMNASVNAHRIDLHMVSDLVEKYLEQKSIASQNQHYDKILSTIRAASENREKDTLERRASILTEKYSGDLNSRKSSVGTVNANTTVSIEEAERNVSKMIEELETQLQTLREKVHESGIEELKETLLSEMQKMQELILNSTNAPSHPKDELQTNDEGILEKSMDERFQKQQEQLEEIQSSLQSKMKSEIGILETKLETQETFWKSKFELVEEEYQQHLSVLKEQLEETRKRQSELLVQHEKHEKILELNEQQEVKEITEGKKDEKETNVLEENKANYKIDESGDGEKEMLPVPKPRKMLPTSSAPAIGKMGDGMSFDKPTTESGKPQRRYAPQPPLPPPPKQQVKSQTHEYEEPKTMVKKEEVSDYSYSLTSSENSGSDTEVETDEELTEEKHKVILPTQTAAKYTFDPKKRKLVPIDTKSANKAQIEKMNDLRKKAVAEISDHMQRFGVSPDENGPLLTKDGLRKSLGRMQSARNTAVDDVDSFERQRRSLKKEVDITAKKLAFQDKVEKSRIQLGIPKLPEAKTSVNGQNSLRKILSAVTSSGKWKRKVVSPTRKSPKKKHRIKTFFSRAGWKKKKAEMTTQEKVSEGEDERDSESRVDVEMPAYMTHANPIQKPSKKSKPTITKTSGHKENNHSSSEEDEVSLESGNQQEKNDDTFRKKKSTADHETQRYVQIGNASSSGRYVTTVESKAKPSTQSVDQNHRTFIGHEPMNGVFNQRSPTVSTTKKSVNVHSKRDLLVEFQEAEEVKQALTSNIYSPIKKIQGDNFFYGSDENVSLNSQLSYTHQELSEYSEEDEGQNKNTITKQLPNEKGQYVTLRHPDEMTKMGQTLPSGSGVSKPSNVETSTPKMSKRVEDNGKAFVNEPRPTKSTLFSSASAWDTDSEISEEFVTDTKKKTNGKTEGAVDKIKIPTVAPKVISKSSASPFTIIKKATVANATGNGVSTSSKTNIQSILKQKKLLNDSWDSDD